ncbi:MAG: ABC transporter ATP-binding protein, partial [Anaerolineae bacterium]|nr:ABC transporter ATP-binding protein [Anaerolineae bacterium]
MTSRSEFSVTGAYAYTHASTTRWLLSHVWRYRSFAFVMLLAAVINSTGQAVIAALVGDAFTVISRESPDLDRLRIIVTMIFGAGLTFGIAQWTRNLTIEVLAQRLERESRNELYQSLLGKSQTFHDRQR